MPESRRSCEVDAVPRSEGNPERGTLSDLTYYFEAVRATGAIEKADSNIDFQIPYEQSGVDSDWRWGEQWLPHAAWCMLAVAAGGRP